MQNFAADAFRKAPWTAGDIRLPGRAHLAGLLFKMAEEMGLEKHSERLEMVDRPPAATVHSPPAQGLHPPGDGQAVA